MTYAIYVLTRKRRCRSALSGRYYTIPSSSRYLCCTDDLWTAMSVARGVQSVLKVPTFMGDLWRRPTLEGV